MLNGIQIKNYGGLKGTFHYQTIQFKFPTFPLPFFFSFHSLFSSSSAFGIQGWHKSLWGHAQSQKPGTWVEFSKLRQLIGLSCWAVWGGLAWGCAWEPACLNIWKRAWHSRLEWHMLRLMELCMFPIYSAHSSVCAFAAHRTYLSKSLQKQLQYQTLSWDLSVITVTRILGSLHVQSNVLV